MKQSKPLSELKKKISPEVLHSAKVKTDELLFNMRLAEIRDLTDLSQTQLAKAMGISQPSVASIEKAGKDVRLMSLKRYVEAAGCKMRIDIELPDGNHYGFPV